MRGPGELSSCRRVPRTGSTASPSVPTTPSSSLGVDRDSGLVAHDFDERNPAVLKVLASVIDDAGAPRQCRHLRSGPSGPSGSGVGLVEQGIESMSLDPDTVVQTWLSLTGAIATPTRKTCP